LRTGAMAVVARLVDDAPASGARRARRREAEQALVVADHAGAAARRARPRVRARLGADARAHRAWRLARDVHRRGDTVHRILERQVELGLEIGAALRTGAARRA